MTGRRFAIGLLLGLGWLLQPARAEVAVVDDQGARVVLSQPARRIVALSPHLTELLFASGAGDHLVGTVQFADFPPAARHIPRVGSGSALDVERILALRPDLVVAWGSGNPAAQVATLRRLGLTVWISEPHRLEDVSATLRRLGQLAGTPLPAEAAATAFDRRLADLRRQFGDQRPVEVFYQIWDRPLMTVGGHHLISSVITLCGGRNIFGDLAALAPTVDPEAVLKADPEVIVASGIDARRPAWLDDWRAWPRLRAVRSGALVDIPPDLLQQHTPRLLDGAERLCGVLAARRQAQAGK